MISKLTGAGFDLSAPDDVIAQHSFTKAIFSKPSNGPTVINYTRFFEYLT